MAKKKLSREKAKEILEHGEVRDHPLTRPQRGYFGMIAGGETPTKTKPKKRKK